MEKLVRRNRRKSNGKFENSFEKKGPRGPRGSFWEKYIKFKPRGIHAVL
jgi:hypothetical protein